MERRTYETSRGLIRLWCAPETLASDRPLILAIPGALQEPLDLAVLADMGLPCDIAITALPGMFSPFLDETSVPAFAQAVDEMLRFQFSGRRILRCGVSAGGWVAMAMREGQAFVAVDSLLTTAAMAHLAPAFRARIGDDARGLDWVWRILGIGAETTENRDYRALLSGAQPGVYVIAGEGAMSIADRRLVVESPGVQHHFVAESGHEVLKTHPMAVAEALRRGLALPRPNPSQ